jgi:hypothetical protein
MVFDNPVRLRRGSSLPEEMRQLKAINWLERLGRESTISDLSPLSGGGQVNEAAGQPYAR